MALSSLPRALPLEQQLPRHFTFADNLQAIESYWAGKTSEEELQTAAKAIRKERWEAQKNASVDIIPS